MPFTLNGNKVESVRDAPEKFLGSLISLGMKSEDALNLVAGKLESYLSNIEASSTRDEYKLAVYSRYSLPSLRYLFSVHDLTKTQLNNLDGKVTKVIKKWLKIPSQGASTAFVFSPDGLNVKLPSQLYKEAHVLCHVSSRVRADDKVRVAFDAKVSSESQWSRKMLNCNASVCEST